MGTEYPAPLRAPFKVGLWLSDECNLACKYCFAAPFSGNFAPADRLLEVIRELHELQVFMITLGGGEPFLHPRIFDILELCLTLDLQTAILTNGTLLNEEKLVKLAKLITNRSRFLLQVSLDSPDAGLNDKVRGMSTATKSAIFKAASLGVPLQIGTVLTSLNISSAHSIIDFFYPLVTHFHFNNLQPTAKSLQHPELFPTQDQSTQFWLKLEEYQEKYSDLYFPSLKSNLLTTDPGKRPSTRATFAPVVCCVALTQAEISPSLDVYGCDIAKEYSCIGNILHSSFQEVWNSEAAHKVRMSPYPLCEIRSGTCHKKAN
jgi:MoaA/NifB/PqqE/SkfB family radical SAM enzyme